MQSRRKLVRGVTRVGGIIMSGLQTKYGVVPNSWVKLSTENSHLAVTIKKFYFLYFIFNN